MAKDIFIGFDLGTTVFKAAAVEAGGRSLAAASSPLAVKVTADGGREQNANAVRAAMGKLAATLRRELGRRWANVAGLGLAAQGGSAILADRDSGRALTTMQLWSDTRPLGLLAGIAARKGAGYWRRLSGLDGPGAGLARILWLRRRHPKRFRKSTKYVGAGEYAYFSLTGRWLQDAGSALQIGCYDIRRQDISAEPLEMVGLNPSAVAPMRQSHPTNPLSLAGAKLLGLPAGLPVAGPYMDHEAGYLAACGASRRPMQCSLGTAWVGNFVTTARPPEWGLNLLLPSPLGKGNLVVRVMLAGNASWDWALDSFVGGGNALAKAERIFRQGLLPPSSLVGLPWLTRPNFIWPIAAGAGGFVGISPLTSPADLLRALAAGMCYEFARLMKPVTFGHADAVVLSGGAANGWQFRTMLAGLFAPLPALLVEDDFAGARGTLHAFEAGVSSARVRPIPRPARKTQQALREGLKRYEYLCRTLARGLDAPRAGFFHLPKLHVAQPPSAVLPKERP